MLGYIRESIQGWIAWAIVILLIIPFALWGINEYFGTGGALVVANVNGEEISQQQFQREYYMQRDRMREMLGNQFDANLFDNQLKQKAINDIVDREILAQTANKEGFRISNGMLIQTIESFEAFHADGKFSNDIYKQQLAANGETPTGFEAQMRRRIVTQQLYSGIVATSLTTQHDVNYLLKLQEQQRDVGYMVLKADTYKQDADATDEEIQKKYSENSEAYMTPEKVSIRYLELNSKDLQTDQEPTEENLHELYEERKSTFGTPEERRSRHILLTIDAGADEAKLKEVKQKADDLYKQIKEGADFEKLAKEQSQDPGSSQLGGDIGFFGKGSLDPAYEDAMFNLKVGEVSEPVLSAFGYHIIKLEEIKESTTKSFEEVKDALIKDFKQDLAHKKYFELSEKLTNLAYEVPTSLEDAAGATGLQIKTTPLFARSGPGPNAAEFGVATNPKVVAAAFSEEVLKNGFNSELIELGENHVAVVRVDKHEEAKQRPLEEVRDQIKASIIREKSRKHAQEAADRIIAQLKKGEATPEAAAKIVNVEWKSAGALKRTDRTIDAKIVQQAFKAAKPQENKPTYDGIRLDNGDYAVFAVNKVIEPEVDKLEEAKRLTLKRNLADVRGKSAFDNVLSSLKDNASILIKQDSL